MDSLQLWKSVLAELELSLSRANFTTWFKDTGISSYADSAIIISVPNAFTQTWLKNKYHKDILRALRSITSDNIRDITYRIEPVRFVEVRTGPIERVETVRPVATETPTAPQNAKTDRAGLNTKYTFDTFIVGKNNELAYAACRAVSGKPGQVYNPLFLYGGVGLGKTHLIQAIGHALLTEDPSRIVRYVTCEQFTNEFINMVRSGRAKEFKDSYRNADLLLIDDIQFITGKEGTQEELFHTFNTLHQLNKQVVFTSDRPPKAIPGLESRLQSRFEWGMIADIALPDLETRIAIIRAKCELRGLELEEAIIAYIASTIQNNIRELEGALNRVVAFHELNASAPTLESAKNILSSLSARSSRRMMSPKQIISIVAEFYDISLEHLTGVSRKKELVNPRQIAMYLLREEAQCSYPTIGQELGGRDHTTAIHAYDKISKQVEVNDRLRQEIRLLREKLYVE